MNETRVFKAAGIAFIAKRERERYAQGLISKEDFWRKISKCIEMMQEIVAKK